MTIDPNLEIPVPSSPPDQPLAVLPLLENDAIDVRAQRRSIALVGWGIFVTSLGQTAAVGLLPLRYLLKEKLGYTPDQMAGFLALVILPWNFKLILGLLSDNVRLFGTRRRHYLLLSTMAVAGMWLVLALVPRTTHWLLSTAIVLNVAMVMASVVVGGLLVECGQKYRTTGRMASARMLSTSIAGMVTGVLGGYLASKAFGWTAVTGAVLLLSLTVVTFFFLPEARSPAAMDSPLHIIGRQLKASFSSGTLWVAGLLIFLVQICPGFQTPLFYYQTDTLHLTAQFIGTLGVISYGVGVAGCLLYARYCKTITLRKLLAIGIFISIAATCAYYRYATTAQVIAVEAFSGLAIVLVQMPLHDLASRATPKGSEAMGYALMMSAWNLGMSASDVIGSHLYTHYHVGFRSLIWLNAGTTALVLLAIPLLPKRLVETTELEGVILMEVTTEESASQTKRPH